MTAADRFWAKVDTSGSCWTWCAYKTSKGYGIFRYRGQSVRAHRWLYEQLVAPVPPGLELDHLCRNRACVRPDHLEPVTHRANVRRGEVGAIQRNKTHCPQGHPFDAENTYLYKNRRGSTGRRCRACNRAAQRKRVDEAALFA